MSNSSKNKITPTIIHIFFKQTNTQKIQTLFDCPNIIPKIAHNYPQTWPLRMEVDPGLVKLVEVIAERCALGSSPSLNRLLW